MAHPATLPPWAARLAAEIRAKQANAFVLHGVPADLVPVRGPQGLRFRPLDVFLAEDLFGGWPSVGVVRISVTFALWT